MVVDREMCCCCGVEANKSGYRIQNAAAWIVLVGAGSCRAHLTSIDRHQHGAASRSFENTTRPNPPGRVPGRPQDPIHPRATIRHTAFERQQTRKLCGTYPAVCLHSKHSDIPANTRQRAIAIATVSRPRHTQQWLYWHFVENTPGLVSVALDVCRRRHRIQ
jgi:hypothetical protein